MRQGLSRRVAAGLGAGLGLCALVLACSDEPMDDDTTAGDDDTTAGDDDDTAPFASYRYDVRFHVEGESADVALDVVVLDDQRQEICTYPIAFEGRITLGSGQGGVLWDGVDESVELLTAQDPGTTDCPPEIGRPYHDSPADLIDLWSPLAFLSCEVASTMDEHLGDDPTTAGDGSFAGYCATTAPAVRDAYPAWGLGVEEGIWLAMGVEGQMDGLGDYTYLPAADGSSIWFVWGLLYAAEDNPTEPATGLEGAYVAVPFWLFVPY